MAFLEFDKRVRRIERKHRKMARGGVPFIDRTGLVSMRPRRARIRVPLRGLLLLAAGFIAFKGLVLADLGGELYAERLETLSNGTVVEQAGAWIMQADPASKWVAARIWPMLN
jgi:hypothetical protein